MIARLTRQGWMVLVAAVLAVVVGRLFGVLELFVIGAAMAVAAGLALPARARAPAADRRPPLDPAVGPDRRRRRARRGARRNACGGGRSPSFELVEPVGPNRTARMAVAPLPPDAEVSAGYRIPTERRGVLTIGPLTAVRHDVLGLARSVTEVAGLDEVLVSPRAHLLDMPTLGQGVLGRHLLALAQRLGPGDFHSLREYVDGDEPRSIHWRASARSETLKVRQHAVEGLRRCLVLLDQRTPPGDAGDEAFERAVTVAASVVHSADRAGLTTRFVTTDGADIRGPDVAAQTLHLLARITASSAADRAGGTRPGRGARAGHRHRRLAGVVAVRRPRAGGRPDPDGDRRVHAGAPGAPRHARRRRPHRGRLPRRVERRWRGPAAARPGRARRRDQALAAAVAVAE